MELTTTACDMLATPRLGEILRQSAQRLVSAGIESARLDAEVLLGHALAMSREQLVAGADSRLGAEQAERFEALILRRLRREPVAYITGRQEFWSLDFQVTRAVLIPRPETERVIEVALRLAARLRLDKTVRVLDVGTGSGAIAVSLAKELPAAKIFATDISPAALAVARANASRNEVARQMTFLSGDLFGALGEEAARFDLIVSNPPYLQSDEIATLEPEVSEWEPRAALDGGRDGLDFYRQIAAQAGRYLMPNGAVVVEIGALMGSQVAALFNRAGFYREVTIVQDYAGRDRVAVAKSAADLVGSN